MADSQFLRAPEFRAKYVQDNLIWPTVSTHVLKKLTGKEIGDGVRHTYTPADVRKAKLSLYKIDESTAPQVRPPLINCRMAKGGTGKTTVAANTATALAFLGYRVLAIDADPQASLTNMLGVDASSEEVQHIGTLMQAAAGNGEVVDVSSAVRHIFPDGMLDLLPADITLINADSWLTTQMQRETSFDRLIAHNLDFFSRYDVIVVDSAPGTSLLSLNVMVAARTQLAVVWLDRENLKAIPILASNVDEINRKLPGHASDIELVANGYNGSYKHSKEALDILVAAYSANLNPNVLTQYSGFNRQQALPGDECKGALIEQEPTSPGAKAMMDLTKSLLGRYKIKLAGHDESIPTTRVI